MTPHQFIAKWMPADLKERAACQEHFLDLCAVLGEPTPAAADPTGTWFTFEKGVSKDTGGQGYADVWRRGFFGWEYKGKRKDLKDAYRQLCQYRESLLNPPLLVVCDLNRFEIHTNFPNTAKEVHAFDLDGLADPLNVAKLKAAFADPDKLKPGRTQKQVTEEVAKKFAEVADGMRGRGVEPHAAGHFLMKLMFCMFAEDIELLPKDLFLRTVRATKGDPAKLSRLLADLFAAMAESGGTFGADDIPWVNGGLFKDAAVLDLTSAEIKHLEEAATYDWSAVDASIFGTLFERILDPNKRSQLGAHYTSRDDILTLLEPVLMAPLRAEWAGVKAKAETLYEKAKGTPRTVEKKRRGKVGAKPAKQTAWDRFDYCVEEFLARLESVTVLDPACGSGNFLYIALQLLLDLEKEVLTYMASRAGTPPFPGVRPTQLRGIELNPYAHELASVVVWIGFLQWMKMNGFIAPSNPVLDSMENIQHRDAVLDLSDPANPNEPDWPDAEFIVGNPPFLGGNKMRATLGDGYVEQLFALYSGRVSAFADLSCYWFEKARHMVEAGRVKRVGLLSTQGIRGGVNRDVLDRVKTTGDIFFAMSDMNWLLDGAMVHISMVGFDTGAETSRTLDGKPVSAIHADLTSGANLPSARSLAENQDIWCYGSQQKADFDIPLPLALKMLKEPNAWGKPNSDVIRVSLGAKQLTQRTEESFVIDFGLEESEGVVARYELPFEHVRQHILPIRLQRREARQQRYWWLHARPSPRYRVALKSLGRVLVISGTAKNRLFVWQDPAVLVDHSLIVFRREDDYFFGVLQSCVHDRWAWRTATQVRERESGLRYTPTTCFETFPFPEPTDAQRAAIAEAAKTLDTLRNNWLNPPEWVRTEVLEFPGSVDGPWKRFVVDADARGIGTVKYPRVVPKDAASEKELKKRTLTNLYNKKPAWLTNAHKTLDDAVLAAYGWPADIADDDLLAKLLELNLSRAGGGAELPAGDDE